MAWEWKVDPDGTGYYEDTETGQRTGPMRDNGTNWESVPGAGGQSMPKIQYGPGTSPGIIAYNNQLYGQTEGDTGGGGNIGGGSTGRSQGADKSDADLRAGLEASGYGGPWDRASMVAAWDRAPGGGGPKPGSAQPGYGGGTTGYSSGGGSSGSSFPMAGGLGQLDYDIQIRNQELLNRRLKELDIPGLRLQERAQIIADIYGLRNATGYIDPEREARDIYGYTKPVDEGGYGAKMPTWFRPPPAETAPPGGGTTPSGDQPPDNSGDWVRGGPDTWANKRTGAQVPGKFTTPWTSPFPDPHDPNHYPKPSPEPDTGGGPIRGPISSGSEMFAGPPAARQPTPDPWEQMTRAWPPIRR